MDFNILFNKIAPKLKMIARRHNGHGFFIDEDDLYQEMCIRLWNNFKDGVPDGINEAYIARGCEFHILNYLRIKREKAHLISLEEPIGENGTTLKEFLPNKEESLDRYINRTITIDTIKNNGFSKREKEVFSLLLEGYTVREAGNKMGVSHVMVIKLKQSIIRKWKEKDKIKVTKNNRYLL